MRSLSLLKYIGLSFIFCLAYQNLNAQGVKGIVPIKSNCHDVQRLLGGRGCGKSVETLIFPNETIKISYTTKRCQQFYGDKTRWNVPVGTVFIIVRKFKVHPTLDEIGIKIDESEYIKQTNDIIGQVTYVKKDLETVLTVTNGYVSEIYYYPSIQDSKMKSCSKSTKPKNKNSLIKKDGVEMIATYGYVNQIVYLPSRKSNVKAGKTSK